MINGLRRAIGEAVERLGAVIAGTSAEVVRRYNGTGNGIQTGVSVKQSAEAASSAGIDRENLAVPAGAARTGNASPRLMSVDELTTRIPPPNDPGSPSPERRIICSPETAIPISSSIPMFEMV